MSARSKRSKKNKPDPYAKQKVVAIPLLLVVLGYVLWSNSQGSGTKADPAAELANASPTVVAPSKPAVANADDATTAWPEPVTDFLDGANPFASFRATKKQETKLVTTIAPKIDKAEELRRAVSKLSDELAAQPLRYFFQSGDRNVVMLGDRLYQNGDRLSEQMKLREIQQENLVLQYHGDTSEAPPPPAN